jgi:hypothetical protein
MTEKEKKRIEKMRDRTIYLKQRYTILSEQNQYKTKNKQPSTSKLLLWVVVLICLEIVFFSEYAMIKTGDTSALYALIGVPATLIPTVLGYFHKSMRENTKNGIIYEMAVNGEENLDGENKIEEVESNGGD